MTQTFEHTAVIDFGTRVLRTFGVQEADAELISDSLVTADMWGHASHGMLRLPWYTARLESGATRTETAPETIVDLGALVVIDGHDGIGQVVTDHACTEAVRRAETHGVGLIAVRNSGHFGTAAYWTRRMAQAGCVGILTTNSSPAMAPWGGNEKTVGSNPWSIAAPGGSHPPVMLDISNTSVARGKLYSAMQKGQQIPLGWAMDSEGRPTTDPAAGLSGIMLPVGEHKGYGISFMMDVLSGVLTGSNYATGVSGPYVPDARSGSGHLVIAIKIDSVLGDEEFAARIDDLIGITKRVKRAEGFTEVFYPGEMESGAEARSRVHGVSLPVKTVNDLRELAASRGVAFDLRSHAA